MKQQIIKKQKGFAVSLLLISLPVFITCLMGFTALLFSIRNHDLAQKICIKAVLNAQTQMQIQLEQLLKLNPTAKQLKLSYQHISHLLRIAIKTGEPYTISALKAKKAILKQKRLILDRVQKQILKQSQISVQKIFFSFKQQMKKFNISQAAKTHNTPKALAVKARYKRGIAPVYYTPSDFSKKQTLSLYWKMPLYHFIPRWIQQVFFTPKLSSYNCASTLKKKDINGRFT